MRYKASPRGKPNNKALTYIRHKIPEKIYHTPITLPKALKYTVIF
jgi:hypothetical protein